MEELLIKLLIMYDDGRLANEFDTDQNDMVPSVELEKIMEEARELLPSKLTGPEAHALTEAMTAEETDVAIENSGSKVADLRKEFQRKMSINGGARGLIERYVKARSENDDKQVVSIMEMMIEFAEAE